MKASGKKRSKALRPHGTILIIDGRGFSYVPSLLRREFNMQKGSRIPFFISASAALLIRKDATLEEVLKSIDILKEDIKLRWKREGERQALGKLAQESGVSSGNGEPMEGGGPP
jgi:hypothetical protein